MTPTLYVLTPELYHVLLEMYLSVSSVEVVVDRIAQRVEAAKEKLRGGQVSTMVALRLIRTALSDEGLAMNQDLLLEFDAWDCFQDWDQDPEWTVFYEGPVDLRCFVSRDLDPEAWCRHQVDLRFLALAFPQYLLVYLSDAALCGKLESMWCGVEVVVTDVDGDQECAGLPEEVLTALEEELSC